MGNRNTAPVSTTDVDTEEQEAKSFEILQNVSTQLDIDPYEFQTNLLPEWRWTVCHLTRYPSDMVVFLLLPYLVPPWVSSSVLSSDEFVQLLPQLHFRQQQVWPRSTTLIGWNSTNLLSDPHREHRAVSFAWRLSSQTTEGFAVRASLVVNAPRRIIFRLQWNDATLNVSTRSYQQMVSQICQRLRPFSIGTKRLMLATDLATQTGGVWLEMAFSEPRLQPWLQSMGKQAPCTLQCRELHLTLERFCLWNQRRQVCIVVGWRCVSFCLVDQEQLV
jgi:hypothetical protein